VSVSFLLYLAAFLTAIVSATGRCPVWVSVVLLAVAGLLQTLPV
jgi:hypothetical protein